MDILVVLWYRVSFKFVGRGGCLLGFYVMGFSR